jgi:hypothetical protein
MKKFTRISFIILLLSITYHSLWSQTIGFTENFNDGDLTNNPTWTGQRDSFKINANKELQLNAKQSGIIWLDGRYNSQEALAWEFYVRMEFSPSATNMLAITLDKYSSGGAMTPTYGYGISLGEDGSNDRIKLVRFYGDVNSSSEVIGSSTNLLVKNNQVNVRMRIKRDVNHLWTIDADYDGGFAFKNELTIQEKTPFFKAQTDAGFNFKFLFTESRKDKFFIDDIKVYKNEPDQTAPKAILAKALTQNTVEVQFDEVIDSLTAKTLLAYNFDNGLGTPKKITYQYDRVLLETNAPLQSGATYNVLINSVKDLVGNVMQAQSLTFTAPVQVFTAMKYDVIINEVFADPIPQVALPKVEFVELYNRTSKPIELGGWSVKDAGKTLYKLPKFVLLPQKYVILYKRDAKINFGKYGDTLAMPTFFALDTGGDEISLFDDKDNLIDLVRYDLTTYGDAVKANGGYTLERINPETPCLGAENWKASNSTDGGTPGKQNSVFSTTKDNGLIALTYIFPISATDILLRFNRSVDIASLNKLQINGLKIATIKAGLRPYEATLTLETPMLKGKIYELLMPTTIKDCIGNAAQETKFQIALPEVAAAKDIVINEILFNPKTNGFDFVELYNRSDKAINIAGLVIDNRMSNSLQKEITSNYLLLPKGYVVISENIDNVKANYEVKDTKALLQNALPSFSDDKGNVTLYLPDAPGKKIIDALDYSMDWHYGLLRDQSGVSLERLNPDLPTKDSSNWHSAASIVGFATPTYQNSQFSLSQNTDNELFSVSNQRLSPDNDGFEDFTIINYKTSNELNATLRVFDLNGHLMKTIVQNETLATEGQLRWDGDMNDGSRATLGIYVLLIEYFTPDGKVGKEKKTLTVVYRL